MPLRKSIGNMFPWVGFTWNPIFGQCSHQCGYCYMKKFKLPPVELREKELKIKLGSGKTIFIGSATDMFAHDVPGDWINKVLTRCKQSPDNTYLFQSKNPERYHINTFPKSTILGTTIESNRRYKDSKAPSVHARARAMAYLVGMRRTVTIEPIMAFDTWELTQLVQDCAPEFVSIGADSKGHHLQEPGWNQVWDLITRLNTFTEVRQKNNLERLRR